jgi:hypothetical protein
MRALDVCLRQINEVKKVASGAELAYVARSRVARLILNTARFAAGRAGVAVPDRPTRLEAPAAASPSGRGVIACCNRILDVAKTITQPSEPLDERWRSGWANLLTELDELETRLRALKEAG